MSELAPGYRFYPTVEELVCIYLQNKLDNKGMCELDRVIPVVDIYNHDPWQLPDIPREVGIKDEEQWFFFTPIQEKETRGGRTNRTTPSGYWKATGTASSVFSSQNRVIGEKKTLVFYKGKAPNGTRTEWKMNEYKAFENLSEILPDQSRATPKLRHEFSVCRIYLKSGSPRSFDRRPLVGESSQTGEQSDQQKRKEISNPDPTMKDFAEENKKMHGICISQVENPSMVEKTSSPALEPLTSETFEDLDSLLELI